MDNPTQNEHIEQLWQDLKEGESWHIEFKDYNFEKLSEDKCVDEWKRDLSHEFAAIGSRGGRIYIGIANNGEVNGIKGSHQIWQEKLFERCLGNIKPKIIWKSYLFNVPSSKLDLIKIEITKGEPIYYVQGKPYIREGTKSHPAEPEEVKGRFKEYFSKDIPVGKVGKDEQNEEKSQIISWIFHTILDILIITNLYQEKQVNPQLDVLKYEVEKTRNDIENNLSNIKKIFGEESDYWKKLELISSEILSAMNIQFMIDGGKSWNKWLEHIKKINQITSELLDLLKTDINIEIKDLEQQKVFVKEKLLRWLDSIDDYHLNNFVYDGSDYSRLLLRLYFLQLVKLGEIEVQEYRNVAEKIEKLSWARTNVGYQNIIESIPVLKEEIKKLK